MKIIVVGNSPSIMEKENSKENSKEKGKEIDTFDMVIRINNFEIDGFEKYVGTKTDHIFCTFATMKSKIIDNFPKEKMYMFVAGFDKDIDKVQSLVNRPEKMNIDISDVNILDSDIYYNQLIKKAGLVYPKKCTTGTIAIEWVLRNYPESDLYFTGIDLYKGQGSVLSRYTGFENKRDNHHDFDIERKYIEKLVDEDIIKRL